MVQQLKKKTEGFTIIEVLIVLAIAALILLIVFLAVPALQRNSRNTQRKNDASRVATEVANYASNNNGNLPLATAAGWPTACGTLIAGVGSFGEYTNSSFCGAGNETDITTNKFNARGPITANFTISDIAHDDGMILVVAGICPSSTGGTSIAVTPGTNRQSALVYNQETNGTNWALACIQAT